jgi:hypothetical protein
MECYNSERGQKVRSCYAALLYHSHILCTVYS